MSVSTLREFFLWSFVIGYAMLIIWWLTVLLKWAWPYDLCAKWFGISRERVNEINFAGLVVTKALVLVLFLIPFLALSFVGK